MAIFIPLAQWPSVPHMKYMLPGFESVICVLPLLKDCRALLVWQES
jgi:hypothetical protein